MATLSIKDGSGVSQTLQVQNGDEGLVSAQTQVAVSTTADEGKFYPGGGWDWGVNAGTAELFDADLGRKGVIIYNSGSIGSAYILIGSTNVTNNGFGTISNNTLPPNKYSFILEPGATYFGDTALCGLRHSLFVPSSSLLVNSSSILISVTEIF